MANWWEPSQSLTSSDDVAAQAPAIRPWSPEQLATLQAVTPTQAPPSLMQAMDAYRQAREPEPVAVEEEKPKESGESLLRTIGGATVVPFAETVSQIGPTIYNTVDAFTGGYLDEGRRKAQAGIQNALGDDTRWQDIPTMAEGAARTKAPIAEWESQGLKEGRQALSKADGVWDALGEVVTRPSLAVGMIAESLPWMAVISGPAKVAATSAFEGAIAQGATKAAAEAAAKTAATRASIAGNFTISGGTSGMAAQQHIFEMSEKDLAANSPDYAALRAEGLDHRAAQESLAQLANIKTTAVAGTLGAGATALMGGGIEGQIAQRLAGVTGPSRGVARNILEGGLKEAPEEFLQSGGERIGENVGTMAADDRVGLFDGALKDAAVGGLVGLISGGMFATIQETDNNRLTRESRTAAESANEQADLIRASLPVLSETELDKALGALRQTLTTPNLPDELRERLTASIGELDTEFQNRANGATLKATLTSPDPNTWLEPRSRNTLIGMARPERFGALSDGDLVNARDLSLRLAEVPSLMEQAPDDVESLATSARAYHQEFQLRRASADLAGALQQNPDIGQALAGQILLDAHGNPSAHQSPEYQRASLDDTQLERWLTSGQALLRDHADTLTEVQRTALPLALDALQQENDFRDNTPNWLERNDAIREQHDPVTQRLLAQLQGKKGANVANKLQVEQLPIIDRLIARLDGQQAPYAQMGVPVPAKVAAPLTLLQQRKTALQSEIARQQKPQQELPPGADPDGDWIRQQSEQQDYRDQQQPPIPPTDTLSPATDPIADEQIQAEGEFSRLLGPAPAPVSAPAPAPAPTPSPSFDDLLNRGTTAGAVPAAPFTAQGPVAESTPAPRPKRTQDEIKAMQGQRPAAPTSAPMPDMQVPDAPMPEVNTPAVSIPDVKVPDVSIPSGPAVQLTDLQTQIAALQAKPEPLASEQARLKRLQNEEKALSGQDELSRLLGPAPAPQPVPRPVASGPQTLDDLLQRDSTAGNVPTAPMAAQGPIAEPTPPAPRPKMTQEEIKARQGWRQGTAEQAVPATSIEPPVPTILRYVTRDGDDRKVAATTVPGLAPHLGNAPQFVVHPSINPETPRTWQVSHQESGAGIAAGETQEAAIQAAEKQLQLLTPDAFNDLVVKFTHSRNQAQYARVNRESAATAERARIEAMIEQRTAEVKDLRAKVQARREAIRQRGMSLEPVDTNAAEIRQLGNLFKPGKEVLHYLDNQAFDARDARGGNVNPRSDGAQLFPIPQFVLDYANGPVPSPTTPETPNEKGQTQAEALLNQGTPPVVGGDAVNPNDFVQASDGSLDFGRIAGEAAQAINQPEGPIRLQVGF